MEPIPSSGPVPLRQIRLTRTAGLHAVSLHGS
jgi:hypothetical protein